MSACVKVTEADKVSSTSSELEEASLYCRALCAQMFHRRS